ncbi:TetR/AcrR family transcriptional regulator [Paenibacillus senegalensis]|uniref:TetR/AcrR family transcriptional regulator n=1 Tax=Paenibacillus senegalensis TaxID=1465766 RepID=UPI000288C6C2|nr:TetR/AcrR family transcriptional regulator [Paenibacillus senegalensis]
MSPRAGLDLDVILQAAARLIDENGYDQISLGVVAKELQVRPPSLYNHLDGLNGLKQKLAIYGVKKLYETMVQAAIGRSGDEAVRALGEAYVQFGKDRPGLYEATFHAPDKKDPELQQAQDAVVQLVAKVFEVYGLKDEIAIHMIRGFRSLLHGFTSIQQMGGFGLPLDLNESLTMLMDTFLQGMHAKAGKSSSNFPD